MDHETLQTGVLKSFNTFPSHWSPSLATVHMMTFPSSEALAMVDLGRPNFGAQATSLTQSAWRCRAGKQSIFQIPLDSFHTFTVLSQPPEQSFCTGSSRPCPTRAPGAVDGAQETEVTPTGWACSILNISQTPSGLAVKMDILPSDDPHAKQRPSSWGAQGYWILIDDLCSSKT